MPAMQLTLPTKAIITPQCNLFLEVFETPVHCVYLLCSQARLNLVNVFRGKTLNQKTLGELHRGKCKCGNEVNPDENRYEAEEESTLQLSSANPLLLLCSSLPFFFFVWLEWITSLTRILVTAYYFTLRLTQQSVARTGSPSVHASCSQTCSRGHF